MRKTKQIPNALGVKAILKRPRVIMKARKLRALCEELLNRAEVRRALFTHSTSSDWA